MRVLAIETSGLLGSVALTEGPPFRVLAEKTFEKGLRHGKAIVPAIARVLAAAGLSKTDVDAFAVGTGPGSYTGLRVGVASAKALAIALGKPLFGVPSMDAAAAALPPARFAGARAVVLADEAREDRIYWGCYRVEGDRLVRARDFDLRPPGRAREGVPEPALVIEGAPPHAREVARIALERAARGERDEPAAVLPLYLRASVPEERAAGSDNPRP